MLIWTLPALWSRIQIDIPVFDAQLTHEKDYKAWCGKIESERYKIGVWAQRSSRHAMESICGLSSRWNDVHLAVWLDQITVSLVDLFTVSLRTLETTLESSKSWNALKTSRRNSLFTTRPSRQIPSANTFRISPMSHSCFWAFQIDLPRPEKWNLQFAPDSSAARSTSNTSATSYPWNSLW